MQNIAIGVQYDGTRFHGWQRQAGGVASVQEAVELALSRIADEPITVYCAGRTDAGVHAFNQVINFKTNASRSHRAWLLGGNTHLPRDISLQWASAVDNDFHARYSATARRYRYFLWQSPQRPALLCNQLTWILKPLNVASMQEAAQALIGTHDFSGYRGPHCQAKSPVRTLQHLEISVLTQQNHGALVMIDIKANGFLHHMVRNIVGVLLEIGYGEQPISWSREILEGRDRQQGGITAPAQGLFFCEAEYPSHYAFPLINKDQVQFIHP